MQEAVTKNVLSGSDEKSLVGYEERCLGRKDEKYLSGTD